MFFDGGMGSMLQRYGMKPGEASDMQNLLNGTAVVEVHRQYAQAGADILTANTFGAYSIHYDNAGEIIQAAFKHLREAITLSGGKGKLMAHDMGPTGRVLQPYGDMPHDECQEIFLQSAKAGAKAGADLILVETMIDLQEMKAAVQAAKSTGLPVIASMTFEKNGRTIMGTDIPEMAKAMEAQKVSAIGMNCGLGPELYKQLLPRLAAITNLPILVQPNAGLPEIIDGQAHYNMDPATFAKTMSQMNQATLLGGCCGTTPDHIKEMIKRCSQ